MMRVLWDLRAVNPPNAGLQDSNLQCSILAVPLAVGFTAPPVSIDDTRCEGSTKGPGESGF